MNITRITPPVDNDLICNEASPDAFVCTRLSAHSGPHVAHASGALQRCIVAVWDDDRTTDPTP